MSSSSVLAQITACENEITEAKSEITKLKSKIEEQESAIQAYASKIDELKAETQDKLTKYANAVSHQAKAVLSFRFRDAVAEKFNSEKSSMEDTAVQIETGMRKELTFQMDCLQAKENHLQNLQLQRSSLHAEYQTALASEEAERQAAADARQLSEAAVRR